MAELIQSLTTEDHRGYSTRGYLIERGVFEPSEVEAMIDHYSATSSEGPASGRFCRCAAEDSDGRGGSARRLAPADQHARLGRAYLPVDARSAVD